jgi:hypothetical protein
MVRGLARRVLFRDDGDRRDNVSDQQHGAGRRLTRPVGG